MAVADVRAESIHDRFSDLVDTLFLNPDIAQIRLDDPRFRWIRTQVARMPREIATLELLVEHLLSRLPVPPEVACDLIEHLTAYTSYLAEEMLEDELSGILSPLLRTNPSQVEAVLSRFGWSGAAPKTLAEAAEAVGVTRERVRQIQLRIERICGGHQWWTPVLDRALAVVGRSTPLPAEEVGPLLQRAGLSRTRTFDAEGLLKAQAVFGRDRGLRLHEHREQRWIVSKDDATSAEVIEQLSVIRSRARKLINNQGIASLEELRLRLEAEGIMLLRSFLLGALRQMHDVEILDGTWFVHADLEVRNPLVNRLNKMLCICVSLPVETAVRQLARDDREGRNVAPDAGALCAFVRYRPEYDLVENRIVAQWDPRPETALSSSEQRFVELYERFRRPLLYAEIVQALESPGLSRPAISVLLRYSPIIERRNTRRSYEYRLLGGLSSEDTPLSSVAAIAPNECSLQQQVGEPNGEAGDTAAPEPQESPEVRQRIRDIFGFLHRGTGVAHAEALIDELRTRRDVMITRSGLVEALSRIEGLIELPSGWVACVGEGEASQLTRRFRKVIAVYPRVPLDIAILQVRRENKLYGTVPDEVFREFVEMHPDFALLDGRLSTADRRFEIRKTLARNERLIREALIDAGTACLPSEIPRFIRGRATVPMKDIHRVVRESCVIVDEGDGRYSAFQPSERINALLRASLAATATPTDDRMQASELASPSPSAAIHVVTPANGVLTHSPSPQCDRDSMADASIDSVAAPDTAEARAGLTQDAGQGWTETSLTPIRDLLEDVRSNRLRLPEIQRGYVWKSTQVRDLFDSLYRGFPIGTMLIWRTTHHVPARALGDASASLHEDGAGAPDAYLLDGQQRLTSLMMVIHTGEIRLVFDPEAEVFEAANAANQRSPRFIAVSDVFRDGPESVIDRSPHWRVHPARATIQGRLCRLARIAERAVAVEVLHGFAYEDVTEVFVRVNSRGTRLKTAELAIAQLAYRLSGMVSDEMARYIDDLKDRGWDFDVQFLLRLLMAITTGRSSFKPLNSLSPDAVADGWHRLTPALDRWLDLLGERLGLTSMDLAASVNNHVVPVTWLASVHDPAQEPRLLEWYVHSCIWGRYSRASATALDQDLRTLEKSGKSVFPALMDRLRVGRSSLRVTARDLEGSPKTSPFALLAFLAARRAGACDLFSGVPLRTSSRSPESPLIMQQIFPSRAISRYAPTSAANELVNHVFLAQDPLLSIPSQDIFSALERVPRQWLEQQCVPTDDTLWSPSRFSAFVQQRRRLMIEAMNAVLSDLAQ